MGICDSYFLLFTKTRNESDEAFAAARWSGPNKPLHFRNYRSECHFFLEVEGKSAEAVFDDLSFGEPECIKVSENGPLEPLQRIKTT